jgi:AraC-like DNA-binding protein
MTARTSPRARPIAGAAGGIKTIVSRDVESASRTLKTAYGPSACIDPIVEGEKFAMRLQVAQFGELTLAKADISNWSMTRDTNDQASISIPLTGVLDYRSGARRNPIEPAKHAGVGRPFDTINLRVKEGVGISVYFPIRRLSERAEQLSGTALAEGLFARMVDRVDLTSPLGRALSRTMKSAILETINLDKVGMGAIASVAYEELLMNLAVGCLFPDVAARLGASKSDCGPAVIRRARDYIMEHAADPLELTRLASDLGITMRVMQENFQRHYGFSPRDLVLQCRLELARQQLLMPGPAVTVTSAALDSGFTNLDHFATKYREKFGELPSETLRTARRHV